MKGFEQALVVKQVSQNIKSFSYLNNHSKPFVSIYPATRLDRNFLSFSTAGFWYDSGLSDYEQPLEDGS